MTTDGLQIMMSDRHRENVLLNCGVKCVTTDVVTRNCSWKTVQSQSLVEQVVQTNLVCLFYSIK